MTTSLLAQKLAANNGSRAQARMFARSAAARAMLNIMLYNDQALLNGATIENYDTIRSYDRVSFNDNGTVKEESDSEAVLTDQLRKNAAGDSKLKYLVGTESYDKGADSQAQWMFFYDSPHGTAGRKIIGRAAFQVLPRRRAGRLSLYAVAGGSKVKNDYGAYPHTYRWGRDIAELNLEPTQALSNWYTLLSSLDNPVIPFKYETMYTSYGALFNADLKRRWLEYWFAEGKNPVIKDAFPTASGKYYHRFNISMYYPESSGADNWYERFKKTAKRPSGLESVTDSSKNSDALVNKLVQAAFEYSDMDTVDSEVDYSGLPFLKRIGSDAWSFETLEVLRRQIAANFNDYCDADAIPTSNKTGWSVTDSSTFPDYTGNERTLYINEVALRLNVTAKYSAVDGLNFSVQSGATNRSKIELSVTPVLIAELVNMYDPDHGDDADKALLNPANYEFQAALKKLALNLAVKAVFTIEYTYEVKNSNGVVIKQEPGSTTATVDYTDNAIAKINYTSGSSVKTVNNFCALNGGYSVGSVEMDKIEPGTSDQPADNIFAGKINAAVAAKRSELQGEYPSGTVTLNVTGIDVRTVGYEFRNDGTNKIAIDLSPFLLKVKDAAANVRDDVKGKGVDFVRMDRVGEMTVRGTTPSITMPDESSSGSEYNFKAVGFIGGIEARDPRQNLNPRYSESDASGATAQKSDWNITPMLVKGTDADGTIPSMTVSSSDYSVTAGAKNRDIDPSEPKYFYFNSDGAAVSKSVASDFTTQELPVADTETATDPAWRGAAAGQHVSTAYIRNAPMASPWEIGLIHRGRAWQTLNIKRAGGFGADAENAEVKLGDISSDYNWTAVGTTYRNGDGAIMEFVKVGVNCRCMGKVPLTQLRSAIVEGGNGIQTEYNQAIIKMLFNGIRVGQTMKQFYAESYYAETTEQENARTPQSENTTTVSIDSAIGNFIAEIDSLYGQTGEKAFRLRSQFLNSNYGANENDTAFTFGKANSSNDAQREELIGKTVNLLSVDEETPPNVFRVIVVAQSIKDVGGVGVDVPVSKMHKGQNRNLECRIGRFDFISDGDNWENNTYFDEITGEVKMLVTIERVPAVDDAGNKNKEYGRMVITNIEFIE